MQSFGIFTRRISRARACPALPQTFRKFGSTADTNSQPDLPRTEKGAIIIKNVAFTLEWVLSSPPPVHQFLESPIMVFWPEGEETSHH